MEDNNTSKKEVTYTPEDVCTAMSQALFDVYAAQENLNSAMKKYNDAVKLSGATIAALVSRVAERDEEIKALKGKDKVVKKSK